MEVKETKGSYYIENAGKIIAKMTYTPGGRDTIIIDHTVVDKEYNGQGLGKKILYRIVDDAREAGLKIIPLCPFAKAVFQKDQSISDVLKQ